MRLSALIFISVYGTAGWAADAPAPVVVSAANPAIGVTADSLATVYGESLATQTVTAKGLPWPTALGDMPGVRVRDSAGNSLTAGLIYVSPTQMNVWIPAGVAPGPATVAFPVTGLPPGVGTAALRLAPVNIVKAAPGLFSLDGSGTGLAAASALRVSIAGGMLSPVPVFQCIPFGCTAVPIDLGVDAPIYLSLYGTGIRGASALSNVTVSIGGTTLHPSYAGPQLQIPGLDQVNVLLPLSLRGSGLVNVTVTVDGVPSNSVSIRIQ